MKKKIIVAALIAMSALGIQNVKAQAFEQGKSYVSVGYGFGNLTRALVKAVADNSQGTLKMTAFGPAYVKYEYGVSDKIGLGVNVAYIGVKATETYDDGLGTMYTDKVSFNSLSVLGRVNFHFATGDHVDPYFGIGAGYKTGGWAFSSTNPGYDIPTNLKGGGLGFETTLGIRFLFTDNIGAFAEIGIAKSVLQVGLVGKF